jgi:hypothetical protein
VYNIFYRNFTGFTLSDMINVSSIIFVINLIFVLVGLVYYVFQRAFPKGDIAFVAAFVLLTLFCIWKTAAIHRSVNEEISVQFRGLLEGIIIISGIGAAIAIPILFHSRKFEEGVL